MRNVAGIAVIVGLASCSPALAQAQPPTDRIFVSVNGGYQVTSNDFGDGATFRENAEDGRFTTDYTVKSGPAFDVSGGALVWRSFGVAVGVTRFSRSTPIAFDASIPHPFFFNRARTVSGEVGGMTREELAVHIQARGVFPVNDRFRVMVFAGPSFFQVKQGLVNDFDYTETYPYDAATFSRGITSTAKESKVGFNAGGDVAFFFTRQLGVGFGVQFAGTTVEMPSAGGGNMDLKVGGLQAGGGLRLRF